MRTIWWPVILMGCSARPTAAVQAPTNTPTSTPEVERSGPPTVVGRWKKLHTIQIRQDGSESEPEVPELPRMMEFGPDGSHVQQGVSITHLGLWTIDGGKLTIDYRDGDPPWTSELEVHGDSMVLTSPDVFDPTTLERREYVRADAGQPMRRGPYPAESLQALDADSLANPAAQWAAEITSALVAGESWTHPTLGAVALHRSTRVPFATYRISDSVRAAVTTRGVLDAHHPAAHVVAALAVAPDGAEVVLPGLGTLRIEDRMGGYPAALDATDEVTATRRFLLELDPAFLAALPD